MVRFVPFLASAVSSDPCDKPSFICAQERKAGPLQRGGTLSGADAAGKVCITQINTLRGWMSAQC